jgi:hypothetical protein
VGLGRRFGDGPTLPHLRHGNRFDNYHYEREERKGLLSKIYVTRYCITIIRYRDKCGYIGLHYLYYIVTIIPAN